jgi:oligosaccharide repeat unit polymerase
MNSYIELLVIGNATIYVLTFWFYYKNQSKFNIGCYLLLIWAISATVSVYFYYSGMRTYDKITFLPFLYLYGLVMLSFVPILKFKSDKLSQIYSDALFVKAFSLVIILISVIPFLENTLLVLRSFQGDASSYISSAYDDNAEGYSNVSSEITAGMSWAGRKLNIINIWLKGLIPILLFYQLTLKTKNLWIIGGLTIAVFNSSLHSYALATRVNIVSDLMYILFIFILFKELIDKGTVRKLVVIGGSIIGGISLLVIAITIYRYDSTFGQNINTDTSIFDWISLYIGEGMLNFNDQMWNIARTMKGDNSFSLFKDFIGMDTFTDNLQRRAYWSQRTGISGNIFYTHIGDFFGDFGILGTIVFISFIVLIFLKHTKFKTNIQLHQIILFSIWYRVSLMGFTFYTYKVSSVSMQIIVMLLTYFIFKYQYKHRLLMMPLIKRRKILLRQKNVT